MEITFQSICFFVRSKWLLISGGGALPGVGKVLASEVVIEYMDQLMTGSTLEFLTPMYHPDLRESKHNMTKGPNNLLLDP